MSVAFCSQCGLLSVGCSLVLPLLTTAPPRSMPIPTASSACVLDQNAMRHGGAGIPTDAFMRCRQVRQGGEGRQEGEEGGEEGEEGCWEGRQQVWDCAERCRQQA